jgi:hypothetical protein
MRTVGLLRPGGRPHQPIEHFAGNWAVLELAVHPSTAHPVCDVERRHRYLGYD